jgi:hypothetical protein
MNEPAIYPIPAQADEELAIFARRTHIGFAPRYLRRDLGTIEQACPGDGSLTVTRVNPAPTPMQFRILASFESTWPEGFRPFSGSDFASLRPDLAAVV